MTEIATRAPARNRVDAASLIIGDHVVNSRDILRCELGEFNGHRTFALRKWYRADDGSLRPTPKGLTISVTNLPWIAEATAAALVRARAENLLPQEATAHE